MKSNEPGGAGQGMQAGPGALSAAPPVRIGWIVDVQRDFMEPSGRLYVRNLFDDSDPGAATIVPVLEGLAKWMRERCAAVVFTGDWHGHEDPEIDAANPDPGRGTYPPHCMGRSPDPDERAGADVIPELRPENPVVLPHDATEEEAAGIARQAVAERRPVFVRKTRFNVFEGNPGCAEFVRELVEALGGEAEFVVIGVARDVCMTQAVDGLLDRGYRVTAVRDATWGLGLEEEAATLGRWGERGRVVGAGEVGG